MAGVNFSFSSNNYEYGSSYTANNYSKRNISGGLYAGAALIIFSNEKWELSLPILARFRLGNIGGNDYEDSSHAVSQSQLKNSFYLGLDFVFGGRAVYMLSEHWGFYTGFLWDIFRLTRYSETRYKGTSQSGGTYELTESVVNVFNHGLLQFVIKFKI